MEITHIQTRLASLGPLQLQVLVGALAAPVLVKMMCQPQIPRKKQKMILFILQNMSSRKKQGHSFIKKELY